jgi:hypothetical protein
MTGHDPPDLFAMCIHQIPRSHIHLQTVETQRMSQSEGNARGAARVA